MMKKKLHFQSDVTTSSSNRRVLCRKVEAVKTRRRR